MRLVNKIFIGITCLTFSTKVFCQTVTSPYEVGTWQDFKPAAISYTFDDNCANQLAIVVPMFDNLGFKLTLFTVINWGPNWTGLQSAANNGHEVASHTVSHTSLNTLSDDQQTTELKNSKDAINSNITGQNCITIAYPNCLPGNETLCSQYYIGARGCQGYVESSTPADMMNISSITCGTQGSVKISDDFNNKVNSALTSNGWCVFLMHAIDGDNGYSPTQSSELSTHLIYVKNNIANFWVATFGNVVRYIRERNAASVSVVSSQTNSFTVQVTDNLDNSIYNYPVTIRRPLPQDWTDAIVTQNGTNVNAKIANVGTSKYIMFDVVPNAGDIVITKNGTTDVKGLGASSMSTDIKLWKDQDKLMIQVPSSARQNLNIAFFDLNGTKLSNFEINRQNDAVIGLELSKITTASGIKIVRITDGVNKWATQVPLF
jgi:oligosaccharide reducing-end xylanase